MTQWKKLPDSLGPQSRGFVVRIRALKDRSDLSFAALAERTSYSKSSWERYLNGKKLPPAEAVTELAAACGAPADQLLALHTLAADDWSAGGASADDAPGGAQAGSDTGPGTETETGTEAESGAPAPARSGADTAGRPEPAARPRRMLLYMGAAVVGLVAVVTAVVLLTSSSDTVAQNRQVDETEFVFQPGRTYGCDIHRDGGRLYAGRSDTTEAHLQQITTSWDVVEAQCLLEHHGYTPGAIDGAYGAGTERAVKRLQEDAGLVVDGIVGPHTWKALRK